MRQIIILSIALTIIFISSCQKDKQIIPQTQSFPNQIGDKWTYRLTNSSIDTINVEIVSQGTLPNGVKAKIWKYTYKYSFYTYIDTVWVSYINNDVRIYDNPCWTCTNPMPYERLHYIFPLSIGNSWFTNSVFGDTTKILNQESISVPAGNFTDVFRLSKVRGYVTNSWTQDTIYFKEHLGLVKFSQSEYSLGPIVGNGIWELVSWSVL